MWSVGVVSGCGQWVWLVGVVSGCGQWMWSVGVASGCGQWVWSVGGGYTVYLIMKYLYIVEILHYEVKSIFSTPLFTFSSQPHPYFLYNFCVKKIFLFFLRLSQIP